MNLRYQFAPACLIALVFILLSPRTSLVDVRLSAQGASTPSPALPVPPTLSTNQRLNKLEANLKEIEEDIAVPRKDIWDKIDSVSTLISGGAVAAIGIYFTYTYREKQRETEAAQKRKELTVLQIQTVQSFMPQLRSEDERAVEAALLAIAALGDSKLATKLADLFRGKGSISALARIARSSVSETAEQAIPPLIAALQDDSGPVRRSAAEALGRIGEPTAAPALLSALEKDAQWEARRSAAEALGRIGEPSAAPALVNALEDASWEVRRSATEALGRIGDPGTAPALVNASMDHSADVRSSAAEALGRIGGRLAFERLTSLALNDPSTEVREAATDALGRLHDSESEGAEVTQLDTLFRN